jgi:hypothetical protein
MKRNWMRRIIGGLSFTSALFVFQACYGTPQDMGNDILVEGNVKSRTTGLPVEGIKVSAENSIAYDVTNYLGLFSFYTEIADNMKIMFEDVDSTKHGHYLYKDTLLTDIRSQVTLEIKMDEK